MFASSFEGADARPLSCEGSGRRVAVKVLQVVSGREVNGALVYCQLLTRRLLEAGHEPILVCRPRSWITRQGLPVRMIESEMRRLPTSDLNEIRALIRSERIDVIHTHMSRAHTFGVLLKWLTGVPVVATAHNRYLQLHWRFNDFVIANSLATERYHRRFNLVPSDQIRTVYCFVDGQRFETTGDRERLQIRRELEYNGNEYLLGVVGEVIPRKGQWYLAQALPELCRRIPELRVLLIGRYHRSERYVRQMRRLQVAAGLFRKVRWLGRRTNVHQYMAALDQLLVTSVEEPFGLVAVEGQLSGTPVIATRTGGLPEIVQDGRNGLLIPARDSEAIIAAVERLYRDRQLGAALVQAGREDARNRFDPLDLTAGVVSIYQEVLQRRKQKLLDPPQVPSPAASHPALPSSPTGVPPRQRVA
jgi:glycosyltransferase involved in cell wall biosynthesis